MLGVITAKLDDHGPVFVMRIVSCHTAVTWLLLSFVAYFVQLVVCGSCRGWIRVVFCCIFCAVSVRIIQGLD